MITQSPLKKEISIFGNVKQKSNFFITLSLLILPPLGFRLLFFVLFNYNKKNFENDALSILVELIALILLVGTFLSTSLSDPGTIPKIV